MPSRTVGPSSLASLGLALGVALLGALGGPTPAAAAPRSKATKSVPAPIHYRLSIPEPTTRYVHVHVEVPGARAKTTQLAMPAWAPGSYLIRDFGKHVYDVEARGLGPGEPRRLKVERVDKQTWTVNNGGLGFAVDYRVFADELSVRTSYIDDRFALLNGTSVLLYVVGDLQRPARLTVAAPEGWDVHTALDPADDDSRDGGPRRFVAPDYDELVDSPLLLGQAERVRFTVAGAELDFVFAAPGGSNADLRRIAADSERIVRAFARTFNGLPFSRYVFLLIADPVGGGGLEHHDSTAMIVQPWIFSSDSGYAATQRLVAHEFFHLWNVKRIHDAVLGPFDYGQENYSELLWFHEGFTETMETRALLRAGLIDDEDYLQGLSAAWTGYVAKPGRNYDSMATLSRDAWIKSYQPAANHGETTVSYYEKGNLIGICLDLTLRLRSKDRGGAGSLEGLFRRLWARRDLRGRVAIDIDDIVAAASAEAGEDMRWFFDRYVYGTEELPLPALLREAGFSVEGVAVGRDNPRAAVWTGMAGSGAVSLIEPGSPAATAGLMLDDEPIAVDGGRVHSVREANERLIDRGVGEQTSVTVFRRERLETLTIKTETNPHRRWSFTEPDDGEDDLELGRLRELWLLEHLE
ncbi:MAG: M61 family metallopeptidase [Myxococcales bacterium]|nr:M61 family metallopeptidase [Myxococcales bacterium]